MENMRLSYILGKDRLTIVINNSTTTISKLDGRIDGIMDRIRDLSQLVKNSQQYNEEVVALQACLNPAANIEALTDDRFMYDGRHVYLKGTNVPMPSLLGERIIEFIEKDYPLEALVNFWKNCLLNPSDESRQCLYDFIESNGVTITNTGYMVVYKGVKTASGRYGKKLIRGAAGYYIDSKSILRRPNGDMASKKEIESYTSEEEVDNGADAKYVDIHSGTFDNTPGLVVRMERSKVDSDRRNECSHGLHVGAYAYASSFGPVTLKVIVNPADVVSVPSDCSCQKIRVCKYFVSEVVSEKYEHAYSDDDYAHLQTQDLKAWIPFLSVADGEER
jgi:hypothetical protein